MLAFVKHGPCIIIIWAELTINTVTAQEYEALDSSYLDRRVGLPRWLIECWDMAMGIDACCPLLAISLILECPPVLNKIVMNHMTLMAMKMMRPVCLFGYIST